jgi:3-isopropylmalate dehydrogenase
MMLRYSFSQPRAADAIENAVRAVIRAGLRTGDIHTAGTQRVNTVEMAEAIIADIR